MNSNKLYKMTIIALFAAIIGILAQITVPLPLIPITGQTFAIGLAATILGPKYGTYTTSLYILLGAVGVPIFAGMTAGFGVIFGPTGGFIIGFIPAVLCIGLYLEKCPFTILQAIFANILGMFITLFFGTVWLKLIAQLSWTEAVLSGFMPFLVVGIVKAILAGWAGYLVRNRLTEANLLQFMKQTA